MDPGMRHRGVMPSSHYAIPRTANEDVYTKFFRFVQTVLKDEANPNIRCGKWEDVKPEKNVWLIPLLNVERGNRSLFDAISTNFPGCELEITTNDRAGKEAWVKVPYDFGMQKEVGFNYEPRQQGTNVYEYKEVMICAIILFILFLTAWKTTTLEDWVGLLTLMSSPSQ